VDAPHTGGGRTVGARAAQRGWRIGAACAALLVLALLGALPWLGGLLGFAALLAGLGALWLQATPLRGSGGVTGSGAQMSASTSARADGEHERTNVQAIATIGTSCRESMRWEPQEMIRLGGGSF